jgi:hypothetical protein
VKNSQTALGKMLAISGGPSATTSYGPSQHRRTLNLVAVSLLVLTLATSVANAHDHGEDELEEGEVISAEPIVSLNYHSYGGNGPEELVGRNAG